MGKEDFMKKIKEIDIVIEKSIKNINFSDKTQKNKASTFYSTSHYNSYSECVSVPKEKYTFR